MTSQTVSNAVARKDRGDQLVSWLRTQQDELAMAAATHIKPSTIVRVAQGALRKDPKLMAAAIANPLSLLHCLLDAARLGHEPGTDQYYLVPFGDEVTGIEGYKGIIERMFRAGATSAVVAEVVYQRDIYRSLGPTTPPVHEFDEFGDPTERGPLRGTYAYALDQGGRCSMVIKLGRAAVMKHKAMSRGSDRADSPWKKWEEAMWKKCPLRGLEAYVPTSSEWLTVRAQAAAVGTAQSAPPVTPGLAHLAIASPADTLDVPSADIPPSAAEGTAGRGSTAQPGKAAVAGLRAQLDRLPLGGEADVAALIAWLTGHPATEPLTRGDVAAVTAFLTQHEQAADGDVTEAASRIWTAYNEANPGSQDGDAGD
jgi:recombination protein RecT